MNTRLSIERRAAEFAGIDPIEVAVWVPPPDMRLKAAEVLVARDGIVGRLSQMSDLGPGAEEIYKSHRSLWKLAIYTPAAIANNPVTASVLARWFQDQLGIPMADSAGDKPPSLASIAVSDVGGTRLMLSQVQALVSDIEQDRIAAITGGPSTYDELRSLVEAEITRRDWG